jgi:hypothetical protein
MGTFIRMEGAGKKTNIRPVQLPSMPAQPVYVMKTDWLWRSAVRPVLLTSSTLHYRTSGGWTTLPPGGHAAVLPLFPLTKGTKHASWHSIYVSCLRNTCKKRVMPLSTHFEAFQYSLTIRLNGIALWDVAVGFVGTFLLSVSCGCVELSPRATSTTVWPIVPAPDDDECRAIDGMIDRGNISTRRNLVSVLGTPETNRLSYGMAFVVIYFQQILRRDVASQNSTHLHKNFTQNFAQATRDFQHA